LKPATIDFETRSVCDLKKHGSWMYAKHPTTRVMCLSYKLPGSDRVGRWHMAHPQHLIAESPPPLDLFEHIASGGLVEAHNAFFERVIWMHVMVKRHGWPEMPHLQWRCSAAKACAASLPRDLAGAARAMGLPVEKDMEGRKLMLKMCKPRKPRKAETLTWIEETGFEGKFTEAKAQIPVLWHEEENDIYRLWDYCDVDVLTEHCLSEAVPDLSEYEMAIWQMDQAINERGARFDLDMARAALKMAGHWRKRLNGELETMTGISAGSKRQACRTWLEKHENLVLPDTAATTLEWYIENEPISGRARRICEIIRDVNRTSTRKYQTMIDKADPEDWRVRDLLMYCGAGTGRWSGKGVQIHNFPARDLIVKDFEEAADDIKSGNLDWCVAMYGDVLKLLSHALRGAIVPEKGREFMVADYSAIEARCVLWLAGAEDALEVFRRGADIYCDMATGIYGYEVKKKTHPLERQFGKQSILGLGYGMGFLTFLITCRKYDIHFSRADTLRIMGRDGLEKYEGWVRSYLCLDGPPLNMDPVQAKRYANKKRQAAKARRRLVDEREDPKKITHELALMKYTVDIYRARYSEVKAMWKDQEACAILAVQGWEKEVTHLRKKASDAVDYNDIPFDVIREHETVQWRDRIEGPRIKCGRVTWYVKGGFLHCELPSGRSILYRDPEIKMVRTSWGESRPGLRYMSVNGVTRKWERTHTYGGKIVENITQAVARDIMANAMLLAYEGEIYDMVFSVHDELVCEVDLGEGSVVDFEDLMSSIPPSVQGCPITAEAERLIRYKK